MATAKFGRRSGAPLRCVPVPDLRPFRGLRYDPSAVPDLGAVLCPPYDVISPAERERLAARDPRNAVRVELPIASAGGAESPYEAAANTFKSWVHDGTLRREDRPLVYLYEQRYSLTDGREASARGFFCRLRLEPYGPGSGVRPHEHTMSAPKEDRFKLLSAVQANLSPVLFLYESDDQGISSSRLMAELMANAPAAEAIGPGGLRNRLWLADPDSSDRARDLVRLASSHPVTIADGHHRYETALRYREQPDAPPGSDFVLALLYDAGSGGLALLPWHRVLGGDVDAGALMASVADWFVVTPIKTSEQLMRALADAGASGGASKSGVFGLWTRGGGALLTVDRVRVEGVLDGSKSEDLRWLDVSVLSSTLSRMIGRPTESLSADGTLTYVADAREAVALVESGQAEATFLLAPTPVESVLAVAAAGQHMPAKSTFFHPKAATGVVFNPLSE